MSVDPYSFDLLNTNWSFLFCQSYCDIFCHTYISIWVLQSCSQSSIWRLKRSAQCARDLVLSLSTHKCLAWPTANDHLLLVFVPILWGCLLSLCLVDMSLEREEEEWKQNSWPLAREDSTPKFLLLQYGIPPPFLKCPTHYPNAKGSLGKLVFNR